MHDVVDDSAGGKVHASDVVEGPAGEAREAGAEVTRIEDASGISER